MRSLVSCFVALALCGCNKSDPAPAPTAGSGSGSSAATALPAPAPTGDVEIFVNDTSVAKVTRDQIATWPRVDTLVPEESRRLGTWATVSITGAKPSALQRPSQNYPDMVPALFPGDGGAPSFGMFDPVEHAKKGQPGLRADAIREVRITLATEGRSGDHQGGAGGDADPSKLIVAIKTPTGDGQLTGAQILALPREAMPGNDDTKGWRLAQLLEAAGIKKFEKLILLDASGGSNIILERKDLDAKTVPFIKLNKQGQLRLRVLKQSGDGWQPAGELRALATIQVAK